MHEDRAKMVRGEFPGLEQFQAYLDSAATTQKPLCVLDALREAYLAYSVPLYRSFYPQALLATERVEEARKEAGVFLHCPDSDIIWTKNATESLNLIARSICPQISPDAEILLLETEHHANLLSWTVAAKAHNKKIRILRSSNPYVRAEDVCAFIERYPKIEVCALAPLSHATGYALDTKVIFDFLKNTQRSVAIVLDATQAAAHYLQSNDWSQAAAIVCSGHKLYGPYGVGVCAVSKTTHLTAMIYGGGNVQSWTSIEECPIFEPTPLYLESGTLPTPEILAFQTALQYMNSHQSWVPEHEAAVLRYAQERLQSIDGVHLIGSGHPTFQGPYPPFTPKGLIGLTHATCNAYDLACLLGERGIATRSGSLCAQPFMNRFYPSGILRLSFGLYSSIADIEMCAQNLEEIIHKLR